MYQGICFSLIWICYYYDASFSARNFIFRRLYISLLQFTWVNKPLLYSIITTNSNIQRKFILVYMKVKETVNRWSKTKTQFAFRTPYFTGTRLPSSRKICESIQYENHQSVLQLQTLFSVLHCRWH